MNEEYQKAIKLAGRQPVNEPGTCFDSAAYLFLFSKQIPQDAILCHGIIIANWPGQEGNKIAHAWVEFMRNGIKVAVDPIWMVGVPAEKFRSDFKCEYTAEYKKEPFSDLWWTKEYPGPFDPKILEFCDKE